MSKKFSTVAKLITLLIVVGIGFAFLSLITYDNMKKMKKNIDIIYFGSYVQVVKLKEINEYLGRDIPETIIRYNNNLLSRDYTILALNEYREKIINNWDYYKNTYKTKDEKALLQSVDRIIRSSLEWIDALAISIEGAEEISIRNMYDNITIIKKSINQLVKHETDAAYLRKKDINQDYEETLFSMLLILIATVVVVLSIAYFISKSIKDKENKLFKLAKELSFANKELKNLTITDPLTTLFNRRYFNTIFDKELKKAKREKKAITFMMIDIDFFKKFNDTYGHIAGDENLKEVSLALKNNLRRPNDYAFRLGGEEFGVLIYDYSVQKATILAERLIEAVRELDIEHKSSDVAPQVTISLGFVSIIPPKDLDAEKLIQSADDALYRAKDGGRNRYYAKYSLT